MKKWILLSLVMFLTACGGQKFDLQEESVNFGQQVKYSTDVDVLWVVDTSGSMAPRQAELAKQVPLFLEGLNRTGLDYNIGVTTMDMSDTGAKGRLIAQLGTPMILRKDTPNLQAVLAACLQPGQGGSGTERGREAMMAALALSENGKFNQGFLRPNALLNVIFLSDEEDKSDNSINYAAGLDTVRPTLPLGDRSWVAHFIGVTATDPSCKTGPWGAFFPGTRYVGLATASGGVSESICGADFKRAVTNIRGRVLEMLTEFALDRKPKIASIVVWVNGLKVPQSEVNGWSYRASTNTIRFHGTAVPAAGARIKVDFDPEGMK